jgi:hypothetical protein
MANDNILELIDAEIARLTKVRSLLAGAGKISNKVIERSTKKTAVPVRTKKKAKRVLSPEARARIADAQRKRWAAQKSRKNG